MFSRDCDDLNHMYCEYFCGGDSMLNCSCCSAAPKEVHKTHSVFWGLLRGLPCQRRMFQPSSSLVTVSAEVRLWQQAKFTGIGTSTGEVTITGRDSHCCSCKNSSRHSQSSSHSHNQSSGRRVMVMRGMHLVWNCMTAVDCGHAIALVDLLTDCLQSPDLTHHSNCLPARAEPETSL